MEEKQLTEKELGKISDLEKKAKAYYDDKEYEKAVELYRKAAKLGGSLAQFFLGFCYENGQGVEKDVEEAFKWYLIAAENGDESAKNWVDGLVCLWRTLHKRLDDVSNLFFDRNQDYKQTKIVSREYLFQGFRIEFSLCSSHMLDITFKIDTPNAADNTMLNELVVAALRGICLGCYPVDSDSGGEYVQYVYNALDFADPDTIEKCVELLGESIDEVETKLNGMDTNLKDRLVWAIYRIWPLEDSILTIDDWADPKDDWNIKLHHKIVFEGNLVIKANTRLRNVILAHSLEDKKKTIFSEDFEVIDSKIYDYTSDDWEAIDIAEEQYKEARKDIQWDDEDAAVALGWQMGFSHILLTGDLDILSVDISELRCEEELYSDAGEVEKALALMRAAAELGDAEAQETLGGYYVDGDGVEEDIDTAIKWYIKAAENGRVSAILYLGGLYFKKERFEDSFKCYVKAQDSCPYNVGWFYFTGKGVGHDPEKAKEIWSKLINTDNNIHQFNIGNMYLKNNQPEEAIFWFETSKAHGGHKAAKWLLESAIRQDAPNKETVASDNVLNDKETEISMLTMEAKTYYDDQGFESVKKAVELYRKAAELGGEYAQYSLGYCYQRGHGVKEDIEEAIKWYLEAFKKGFTLAAYYLGECYYSDERFEESFQWFNKAKGVNIDAWYYLGLLYFNGKGTKCNKDKAKECWSKVTKKDQALLQFKIGYMYFDCNNFEDALSWFSIAKSHGCNYGEDYFSRIAIKQHAPDTELESKEKVKKEKAAKDQSVHGKLRPASGSVTTQSNNGIDVQVSESGTVERFDFWMALKPYFATLRHKEFDQIKIVDRDSLNAKATVISGVYNSVLMRASKQELRLELYINTNSEEGNLKILDHIHDNLDTLTSLQSKIVYDRKEGRSAQRIYIAFGGFELSDRSCWTKYITEIISVADYFFDALEKPMRELI